MDPFITYAGINIVKSIVDGFQQNKRSLIQQNFQQAENEASRAAQRENILLQLQAQRERDALSFENRLSEHDYLSTIQNVWPLTIHPREYSKLFHPDKDGRVPFNILIDNRIQSPMGCLCDSLWSELAHGLTNCFGVDRPYQFNSNAFTKAASVAGMEISLLREYSEHIPTLVLVPVYTESELCLTAHAWGGGMGYQTGSITIPIWQLRIAEARKIAHDYVTRFEKAKKAGLKLPFDAKVSQYVEMFRQEKEFLDKGMTIEDCSRLDIYEKLTMIPPPNEVSKIEKEVYKNVAHLLAHQILLPVGQIVDSYFIEGFGMAPRLPFVLSESGINKTEGEEIISRYALSLLSDMKNGQSLVGEDQLNEFKRSIRDAGFQELYGSPAIAQLNYSEVNSEPSSPPVPVVGWTKTIPTSTPTRRRFV